MHEAGGLRVHPARGLLLPLRLQPARHPTESQPISRPGDVDGNLDVDGDGDGDIVFTASSSVPFDCCSFSF